METGMFSKVNQIYLIKVHAKNMCNCMFHTMKCNHAKQNVYTEEETYMLSNLEDTITVGLAGGNFYDWDKDFDVICKRP